MNAAVGIDTKVCTRCGTMISLAGPRCAVQDFQGQGNTPHTFEAVKVEPEVDDILSGALADLGVQKPVRRSKGTEDKFQVGFVLGWVLCCIFGSLVHLLKGLY
jgi:hypothetical protein